MKGRCQWPSNGVPEEIRSGGPAFEKPLYQFICCCCFFAVALSIICAMSLSFVLIDQKSDTLSRDDASIRKVRTPILLLRPCCLLPITTSYTMVSDVIAFSSSFLILHLTDLFLSQIDTHSPSIPFVKPFSSQPHSHYLPACPLFLFCGLLSPARPCFLTETWRVAARGGIFRILQELQEEEKITKRNTIALLLLALLPILYDQSKRFLSQSEQNWLRTDRQLPREIKRTRIIVHW